MNKMQEKTQSLPQYNKNNSESSNIQMSSWNSLCELVRVGMTFSAAKHASWKGAEDQNVLLM